MSTTARHLSVARSHAEREVPLLRHTDADLIRNDLDGLARRLIRSVPASARTDRETWFLQDLKRTRSDGQAFVRGMALLTSVSAKSPLMHHRYGLSEIVRAHTVRKAAPVMLCRDAVLDAEDLSNSAADIAVRRYLAQPSPANRQAAREALEAQKAHTQLCLDWLNASPTGGAA